MKNLIFALSLLFFSSLSSADVLCQGIVAEITKWSSEWNRNMSYSLNINGIRTPFIQIADDDDETRSMILTVYAAKKKINVKWVYSPDITSCSGDNSWQHYDILKGYITVSY